jgi:1-acyl-sn-glycerol-3-phosphate acyltransferase
LVRAALQVYYTDIEVHGESGVPADGPVLVLANHHNGMIDPMLVVATNERPVRYLAKAPLFKIPVLSFFMRGMDCVAVHRRQDPGYDKANNEAVYEAVSEALAAGGMVGIFPEGKSHTDPWLAEFKHGAARMALEAEHARDFALGLRVQLVGIHFDRTRLFRGKVLVTYAPPLTLEAFREAYAENPRPVVERLTNELHERLRQMVLEAENDELVRMADLVERMGVLEQGNADLRGRFDRKKLLLEGYRKLKVSHPLEIERLVRRLRRYREHLKTLGIRDDHVEQDHVWTRGAAAALKHTALLIVGAPFFLYGFALNALPYWAVLHGVVLQAKGSDVAASTGILVATFLFPFWYALLAVLAWYSSLAWPLWLPLVAAGPICGVLTMSWIERRRELVRSTTALWMALRTPTLRRRLRAMRMDVLECVESLAGRGSGSV